MPKRRSGYFWRACLTQLELLRSSTAKCHWCFSCPHSRPLMSTLSFPGQSKWLPTFWTTIHRRRECRNLATFQWPFPAPQIDSNTSRGGLTCSLRTHEVLALRAAKSSNSHSCHCSSSAHCKMFRHRRRPLHSFDTRGRLQGQGRANLSRYRILPY